MNHSCLSFSIDAVLQLPSLRITLAVLFGITSLKAVSLNSLTLYSIWKNSSLHKPSYLRLANLALSDLMFGAFAEPLTILNHYANIKRWITKYCYIAAFSHLIGYWLASVSLYCLTLISVDRLLAIRLKNRYRSFVTLRRIWMVTIPYWVGMLLLVVTLLLSNVLQFALYALSSCFLFVFLTTITVCYSMAFYSLNKLTSSLSPSSSQQPDNGSSNFDVSQYRRSLITMILVMLTTLLLYLPHFCSAVAFSFQKEGSFNFLITFKILSTSELIVGLNSTVNPLLYLWRMQDIRQAVKTTVKKILRQEGQVVQDQNSSQTSKLKTLDGDAQD